jgi:Flp pilus assembly protein TadG
MVYSLQTVTVTGHRLARTPVACLLACARARGVRGERSEDGQASLEFALVIPLLLLLVIGIFKVGIVYNNYIQLTNGVDAAARLLATERDVSSPPTPCDRAATQAQASAGSVTLTQVQVTIGGTTWTQGGAASCPTLTPNAQATLSAQSSCDLVIMGIDFAPSCRLTASATEIVQ